MRIVWVGWAPAQRNIRLWRPHVSVWVHSRRQTSRRGRTPPTFYAHEEMGDGDRAGDGVPMHRPIGPIPYTAPAGRRPAHPAAPLLGADGGNGARAAVGAWPFPLKEKRQDFSHIFSSPALLHPLPSLHQPHRLREAQHQIHILHCLPGSALTQIVNNRNQNGASRFDHLVTDNQIIGMLHVTQLG